MVYLSDRIERHAKDALHEPRRCFLEGGDAVVRVAAIFKLVRLALEGLAHERIGHIVVLADAEVQQTPLGVSLQGGALGPLDLLELVDFGSLAVTAAANTVGKERLEPRIGRLGHELLSLCKASGGQSRAKTQDSKTGARLKSLLKKVSGTFKACEKPEIYSTRKVPDTFFNRLLTKLER